MANTWILRDAAVLRNCVAALERCVDSGDDYKVTVTRSRKRRSSNQNNTIHMWFGEMAESTGETLARTKEVVKKEFYPHHVVVMFDHEHWVPKSTKDLTVVEMITVMERMQALCAEYEIPITQPDPQWRQNAHDAARQEQIDAATDARRSGGSAATRAV